MKQSLNMYLWSHDSDPPTPADPFHLKNKVAWNGKQIVNYMFLKVDSLQLHNTVGHLQDSEVSKDPMSSQPAVSLETGLSSSRFPPTQPLP